MSIKNIPKNTVVEVHRNNIPLKKVLWTNFREKLSLKKFLLGKSTPGRKPESQYRHIYVQVAH
jgi:hypothetical protein